MARRLRLEREVACDDRVLAAGAAAADYARHLLELAYGWSGRRVPALVVGMAGSKTLEGRLLAVLDPARVRTMPTPRAWLGGALVSALLVVPIAATTLTETPAASGPSGRLGDAAPLQFAQSNTSSPDGLTGTWEVTPSSRPGYVHLRLRQGGNSFSADIPTSQLGDRASFIATGTGPIQFNITREAGTFQVEGTVRAGSGAGTFTFVPIRRSRPRCQAWFCSAHRAQSAGVRASGRGTRIPRRVVGAESSAADAAAPGARGQSRRRARLPPRDGSSRIPPGSLEALIALEGSRRRPDFIRELQDQGLTKLSADELRRARNHGVDGQYQSAG